MLGMTIRPRTAVQFVIVLCTLITSPVTNSDSAFQYRPIEDSDIESIVDLWGSRDLSPKDVAVVVDETLEDTRILIVKHSVMGNTHYGAILLPLNSNMANVPVIVHPTGLNQRNPNIVIDDYVSSGFTQMEPSSSLIKVIPAFRGRTMHYKGVEYVATGDFCDAYDGATDDALALLNVAESLFPEAYIEHVLAFGISRGGNVGLLMAARDDRIRTVIAQMAPVDFYREDLMKAYGEQYKCQFFQGKTTQQARQRMLASSPLYFKPNPNLRDVQIHQGETDTTVPLWNADQITVHLKGYNINVLKFGYPECGHSPGCLFRHGSSEHYKAGVRAFIQSTRH